MKTYVALPFNNQDLNIETIYFTDLFLNEGVVNPATQAKYTEKEIKALSEAEIAYLEKGAIAISSYNPKAVLWFSLEGAKKIVAHTDALTIKDNTITTLNGEVVATAL